MFLVFFLQHIVWNKDMMAGIPAFILDNEDSYPKNGRVYT